MKRSLAGGATIQTSISRARAATARAAARHTADAGRSTVRDTVRRDRVALGWARLTGGDPCYFCAMLAGRGAVYIGKDSARGEDPYHDGCGCIPVPVFSRGGAWTGRSREYAPLWKDSTEGYSGRETIRAFRRAYEARRKA
ncbi:VG15 protein [Actinoplanes oblitus]